jgi:hypothetical protein
MKTPSRSILIVLLVSVSISAFAQDKPTDSDLKAAYCLAAGRAEESSTFEPGGYSRGKGVGGAEPTLHALFDGAGLFQGNQDYNAGRASGSGKE